MQALSGIWKLGTDPENKGCQEHWYNAIQPDAREAQVPGIIQQAFPTYNGVVWYWRAFRHDHPTTDTQRCLIRFGAVDYMCDVWVNGRHAGGHAGRRDSFRTGRDRGSAAWR